MENKDKEPIPRSILDKFEELEKRFLNGEIDEVKFRRHSDDLKAQAEKGEKDKIEKRKINAIKTNNVWKSEAEERVRELLEKEGGAKKADAYLAGFEIGNGERKEFARELRSRYLIKDEGKVYGKAELSKKAVDFLQNEGQSTEKQYEGFLDSVKDQKEPYKEAEFPLAIREKEKFEVAQEEPSKSPEELRRAYEKALKDSRMIANQEVKTEEEIIEENENIINSAVEWLKRVVSEEHFHENQEKEREEHKKRGDSNAIRRSEICEREILRRFHEWQDEQKDLKAGAGKATLEEKENLLEDWEKIEAEIQKLEKYLLEEDGDLVEFNEGISDLCEEKTSDIVNKIKEKQKEILDRRGKTGKRLPEDIEKQLKLIEKDLEESGSIAEFNESISDLCEGKSPDIIDKIEKRKREILEKRNLEKINKEMKEALEKAAQAVVEAEAKLKKAEKSQKTLGVLFNMFKKKNSEEKNENVSEELRDARENLQKTKDDYNNLTRQYMEGAFQDKAADEKEIKFNSIKAKMDAKMLLEDKRMQAREKDGGNAITRAFKKTLEEYHKLSFKQHMMIMGGLFLVSGTAPLVLSAALSGTVLSGVLVANRALSAIGGTATAESMIDNRLKKHREKKGQTAEAQRKLAEEYVLQGVQGLDVNTIEGKMAFLDKVDKESNDEISRRLSELRNIENKQNIAKWVAALGVGAFFAWGGPEKLFKAGAEKLFGKKPVPTEVPKRGMAPKEISPAPKPSAPPSQIMPKGGPVPQVAPPAGVPFGPTPPGGGIVEKFAEKAKEIVPNVREAIKGDSIWGAAEKQSQSLFKGEAWFYKMDKVQRIHFTDSIKQEVLKMRGGKEILRPGDKIDFSFMRNLADKLKNNYGLGGRITPGSAHYNNIEKTSNILRTWVKQNPGKMLTTERAREIIQGVKGAIKGAVKPKIATGKIQAVKSAVEKQWEGIARIPEPFHIAEKIPQVSLKPIGQLRDEIANSTVEWIDKGILKGISPKTISKLGSQSARDVLNFERPFMQGVSNREWKEMREAAKFLKEYAAPNREETFAAWAERIKSGIANHALRK